MTPYFSVVCQIKKLQTRGRGVYYRYTLLDTDRGRTTLEQAISCLCELCEALELVHQCGYIHRDIKRENILVSSTGHPILTDFGISLPQNYNRWTTATWGDPRYAAPELYTNQAEPRSDVYALGVVAYEILAGKLPFRSYKSDPQEQLKDFARQHNFESPPTMREIPTEIQECLHWAMEKNPSNRPTAKQFGDALKKALHQAQNTGLPKTETLTLLPEVLTKIRYINHVAEQDTQILLLDQVRKFFSIFHI